MPIDANSPSSNSAYVRKATKLVDRLRHASGVEASKLEHKLGMLNTNHELHEARKIKNPEKKAKALNAVANDFARLGEPGRASSLKLEAETLEDLAAIKKATH